MIRERECVVWRWKMLTFFSLSTLWHREMMIVMGENVCEECEAAELAYIFTHVKKSETYVYEKS